MKKKILRNKPFKNARGQYNFDLNKNLSVYPYTDDKFLNKDLYSVAVTPADIDNSSTPPKAVLISSLYCLQTLCRCHKRF